MADYIPDKDADFNTWQANFMAYVNVNFASLGLTAPELVPAQFASGDWGLKYPAYTTMAPLFKAATQDKNVSREDYESKLRTLVRQIQAYPGTTNAQRAQMQIPVQGAGPAPPPVPTSRPTGSVDTSQRLQHTISWIDEASGKKAKPAGVFGAQIFIKIGDPAPAGLPQVTLLAIDTATPYVAHFDPADGGKTAYYILRWVASSDGSNPGPISETIAATIPA